MAVIYIDLNAALSRVTERSAGYATTSDSVLITELLQLTSAVSSLGVVHYRPYLVAAYFLEQNLRVQLLKQSGSDHYTMLANIIASLRSLQAVYDAANFLSLPVGFEAVTNQVRRLPMNSATVKSTSVT